MQQGILHMDRLIKVATLVLIAQCGLTAFGADFNEIIRDPKKFHNKRVTVVANVTGGAVERFYLYQAPKPKVPGVDARVIYGLISGESPLYERYDGKRVRVTGIIDATQGGLFAQNACGLYIERVRPMDKIEKPKSSCGGLACSEITWSNLLKNPKSYEHKCVCIIGFAHVRGDAFAIYESEKAADEKDHPDYEKGIFVSPASATADYDRYNKQWIKIKGIVDLEQRGFADYPAGIIAEQVELSSPTPK
jgi:hypothetical protein